MARKISGADADYVRKYKALAGDTSKECGVLIVRQGLFKKVICRRCGKVLNGVEENRMDLLTGYCRSCMDTLNEKQRALDGDPEAIKAIATRQAIINDILQAAREGRVQDLFDGHYNDINDADLDQDDDLDDEDDDF